jgi:ABC-type glycerol-3-phosphate transport system substrate-binding protein
LQDFQNQACVAAKANKLNGDASDDQTGGWLIDTSHTTIFSWLSSFGAEIITPDGEDYQFNTPAATEAFTFLKELYDAGCAWEAQYSDPKDAFAERKALFITLPLIDLPQLEETMLEAKNQDFWSVLAFPAQQRKPLIDLYGPSYAMFSESQEERLAAWLLIKWLVAPEQQAQFIEARGSYPTRNSVLQLLSNYRKDHPQWLQAVEFIPDAVSEPALLSWDDVRWMLEDVGSQLFRYYYTADRIPLTLDLMNETAEELQQQMP